MVIFYALTGMFAFLKVITVNNSKTVNNQEGLIRAKMPKNP